jgi:hypothetical protein
VFQEIKVAGRQGWLIFTAKMARPEYTILTGMLGLFVFWNDFSDQFA